MAAPEPGDTPRPPDAAPEPAPDDRSYRPGWLRAAPFLGNPPPLTRRQWRVLGLVAAASLFETYDIYLFQLALKQIQVELAIPEHQLGLLGAIVRFGALPAFGVALVADRFGRRRVLLFTIVAYTVLTGATALSPDARSFVALQLLARTFAVAEVLLAVVVIAEELDPGVRGWGIGALAAIQSCGAGLAALLFTTVDLLPWGWRSLYLVGLVPLALIAWWRRTLPETARYEAEEQRRRASAETPHLLEPLVDLVRSYPGRFAAIAAVIFALTVAETAAGFFGAKYLQDAHGWAPAAVGSMTFLGGGFAIVGNTLAGWLSDRLGRKPVTIGFLLLQIVFVIAYYNAPGILVVPIWMAMIFTLLGANVTLAAYGSELFPTSYRSTAAGARIVIGTLGAAIGLGLESLLYGALGSHWTAISLLALGALLCPLIVALVFPETAGRSLEEISPERS